MQRYSIQFMDKSRWPEGEFQKVDLHFLTSSEYNSHCTQHVCVINFYEKWFDISGIKCSQAALSHVTRANGTMRKASLSLYPRERGAKKRSMGCARGKKRKALCCFLAVLLFQLVVRGQMIFRGISLTRKRQRSFSALNRGTSP
jgi:hypothetical protein